MRVIMMSKRFEFKEADECIYDRIIDYHKNTEYLIDKIQPHCGNKIVELLNQQEDRINELHKKNTDLEIGRSLFHPHFGISGLGWLPNECSNIYHRTTNQLEKHLKELDIPVKMVSRSSIGDKDYYNLKFELDENQSVEESNKSSDYRIKKKLGIKNVGLVEYFHEGGVIHKTILIDESELNDKYLVDGNLRFNHD